MITKIKNLINEYRSNHKYIKSKLHEVQLQNKELEWAHIFHDSIRGKEWLEELPLNVGRWAGNYSFFYILNRILNDFQPKAILDLGLGESSKFISAFLNNQLLESLHTIVEQDADWVANFQKTNSLSQRSKIVCCPLVTTEVNGFLSNVYKDFNTKIIDKFDLIIVDGPFGSDRFSRYDVVSLIERMEATDEFIILIDDTHRKGEQDTLHDIICKLKVKKLAFSIGHYHGTKSNTIIATKKYKLATSL